MKKVSEEHFANLERIAASFESLSKHQSLFLPELAAAKEINKMLQGEYSNEIANAIERMLKEADKIPHYDGSGWMDYKLHVWATLRANQSQ
jgi:hypothetical protein